MRSSRSPITLLAALIATIISLAPSTALAQYNYCASGCSAFEYPSSWTGCINAPCGLLCSPTAVEVSIPCINASQTISAEHKAICDAAWCQTMQENFASSVACPESEIEEALKGAAE